MDFMYIAAAIGLWGVMALLVAGFEKLGKPLGGKS